MGPVQVNMCVVTDICRSMAAGGNMSWLDLRGRKKGREGEGARGVWMFGTTGGVQKRKKIHELSINHLNKQSMTLWKHSPLQRV